MVLLESYQEMSQKISAGLLSVFSGSSINRATATWMISMTKFRRVRRTSRQRIRLTLWSWTASMIPTLQSINRCKSTTRTAIWRTRWVAWYRESLYFNWLAHVFRRSTRFTTCSRNPTLYWDLMEKFWIFSTRWMRMDQHPRPKPWPIHQWDVKCATCSLKPKRLWSFI